MSKSLELTGLLLNTTYPGTGSWAQSLMEKTRIFHKNMLIARPLQLPSSKLH